MNIIVVSIYFSIFLRISWNIPLILPVSQLTQLFQSSSLHVFMVIKDRKLEICQTSVIPRFVLVFLIFFFLSTGPQRSHALLTFAIAKVVPSLSFVMKLAQENCSLVVYSWNYHAEIILLWILKHFVNFLAV